MANVLAKDAGAGQKGFGLSVVYAAIMAVILLIGAVWFSATWIADQHDKTAKLNGEMMMDSSVESEVEQMVTLAKDYSYWDPYYEAVLANDVEWLYPNTGEGVYEDGSIELIAHIFPGHQRHQGWDYSNIGEAPTSDIVDDAVFAKINAALDETVSKREAVTTVEMMNDEIWLFVGTWITPFNGVDVSIPDRQIPRQIMGKRLNDTFLAAVSSGHMMRDFDLSTDEPTRTSSMPMNSVDGTTTAFLSWEPPTPGDQLLREVPIPIVIVFGLVILFLIFAAYQLRNIAKRLETTLDREMLANRHKDAFIATVSHELRTPLTSITASIDMLRMGMLGPLPEKAIEVLEISDRNAKLLNSLIEDLLLIGSIDSGNLRIQREPTEVNAIVKTATENFRGYANEQNVTIELKTEDKPVEADIDVRKVNQVVTNLLSNAAKFAPDGGVVRVEVAAEDEKVRISVSDDGVGIPPNSEEDVFGRFRQVDSGDKRKHNGTGVGLSISREIMNAHGGTLNYESELGIGSTFFMEFPRQTVPA